MNNREINTLSDKLVRDSTQLADTFVGLEQIGKAQDGQVMIKFSEGRDIVVHKREGTLLLLEKQRDELIDSIHSTLRKLDVRPISDPEH